MAISRTSRIPRSLQARANPLENPPPPQNRSPAMKCLRAAPTLSTALSLSAQPPAAPPCSDPRESPDAIPVPLPLPDAHPERHHDHRDHQHQAEPDRVELVLFLGSHLSLLSLPFRTGPLGSTQAPSGVGARSRRRGAGDFRRGRFILLLG